MTEHSGMLTAGPGIKPRVPRWHWRSLLVFSLAILILLSAGVASYVSVERTTSTGNQMEETTALAAGLEKLNSDVFIAQIVQRTYAGTRDQRVLDLYVTTWADVEADITALNALVAGDPAREAAFAKVEAEVRLFGTVLATGIPAPTGTAGPGVVAATAEEVRSGGVQARAAITSQRNGELAFLQERADAADGAASRTVIITTALSAAAVLLLLAAFLVLSRQIRQRRLTELQLAESLAQATDLYHNAPCGYLTIDEAGLVVEINTTGLSWLGYERSELLGTPIMPHVRTDSGPLNVEQAQRLLKGMDLTELEFDLRRKDGTFMPVLLSARLIAPAPGVHQLRASFFDISERRAADARIRSLNSDLSQHAVIVEAANKELEAFCYSVSHDLRAPLRTIDGFSKALLEDYEAVLDESGQHLLSRIRIATQRMGQLIDDLLGLSRVTRGEFARETVDLTGTAVSVAEELRTIDPDREVEFRIAPGLVADGDPRLLRVVLENLLNNAWKYTGKNGRALIEFGAQTSDGETTYFVRDDGAGFDMRYAGKLFGVFQRLHSVQDFSGTGVGLATVQRIIQRHGGRVWAEAAVNEGACFYFTLSAADALAQAA